MWTLPTIRSKPRLTKTLWILPWILLSALALFPTQSLAQTEWTKETRTITDFNAVVLNGVGEVFIQQTKERTLIVETEAQWLPYIRTKVHNQTLVLDIDPKAQRLFSHPPHHLTYSITTPTLVQMHLQGSGTIKARQITTPKLRITSGGSGKLSVHNLKTEQLDVQLDGASFCEMEGEATLQTIQVNGVGQFSGLNLRGSRVKTHISGTGQAQVNASTHLDAAIFGMGSISYAGNPKTITRKIAGMGSIHPSAINPNPIQKKIRYY